MREKLLDLMKSEGLKPSQLAEMLGVNPAGISHMLAGRNKPGFDFLQKILRRFPRINPDWLLLDSPQMYRTLPPDTSGANDGAPVRSATPIDSVRAADLFATTDDSSGNSQTPPAKAAEPQPSRPATPLFSKGGSRHLVRVVLCYEDGSFESYTPTTE